MNLRNLFRKKQIFTATFAGITVTRRGYEHEKEYTWQGQASLFGIDCLLTVTHRTDDEFRNAEHEYLLAKQNEDAILKAMNADLAAQKHSQEQLQPIAGTGIIYVEHDHITISYSIALKGFDVFSTISQGEHGAANVFEM